MKTLVYVLLLSAAIFSCKKKDEMPDEPIPDKDIPGAVRSEKGALVGTPIKSDVGVQGCVVNFPNTDVKFSGGLSTLVTYKAPATINSVGYSSVFVVVNIDGCRFR